MNILNALAPANPYRRSFRLYAPEASNENALIEPPLLQRMKAICTSSRDELLQQKYFGLVG
jgi:hypothetical protein